MSTVTILCTKCEDNKVYFVRYGGLELLVQLLAQYADSASVSLDICTAMRAVTAVDDLRKDFSSAHNHTRTLVSKVRRTAGEVPHRYHIISPAC
jgi:hypothetical protein